MVQKKKRIENTENEKNRRMEKKGKRNPGKNGVTTCLILDFFVMEHPFGDPARRYPDRAKNKKKQWKKGGGREMKKWSRNEKCRRQIVLVYGKTYENEKEKKTKKTKKIGETHDEKQQNGTNNEETQKNTKT